MENSPSFKNIPSGVDVHVVEASGGMTGTSKEIEAVPDDGPEKRLTRQSGENSGGLPRCFFFKRRLQLLKIYEMYLWYIYIYNFMYSFVFLNVILFVLIC